MKIFFLKKGHSKIGLRKFLGAKSPPMLSINMINFIFQRRAVHNNNRWLTLFLNRKIASLQKGHVLSRVFFCDGTCGTAPFFQVKKILYLKCPGWPKKTAQ